MPITTTQSATIPALTPAPIPSFTASNWALTLHITSSVFPTGVKTKVICMGQKFGVDASGVTRLATDSQGNVIAPQMILAGDVDALCTPTISGKPNPKYDEPFAAAYAVIGATLQQYVVAKEL